jgi:RimJ/RimL family protein N-acetyltransferase
MPPRTDRLALEMLRPERAERLFEALRDPVVHAFVPLTEPWSLDHVRSRIDRMLAGPVAGSDQSWLNYVVFREDRLIGHLQATQVGSRAEIAYLFDPRFGGAGYATEAVTWLLTTLVAVHQVTHFWATTDARNIRSIELLSRCGFARADTWPADLDSYDPGDLVFAFQSPTSATSPSARPVLPFLAHQQAGFTERSTKFSRSRHPLIHSPHSSRRRSAAKRCDSDLVRTSGANMSPGFIRRRISNVRVMVDWKTFVAIIG